MNEKCGEADFLKDVATHVMTVQRDADVDRHLIFRKKEGGSCYFFGIVTWPGYLCIYGDMGSYVFRRIEDMFEFFRADREYAQKRGIKFPINPGYWSEKCVSDSKYKGLQEFDTDLFRAAVVHRYKDWVERYRDRYSHDDRRDLRQCLRDEVLGAADDGEHDAVSAAMSFHHKATSFSFEDFYEHRLHSFTYHFIWCLYAISWGIQQYDSTKETTCLTTST